MHRPHVAILLPIALESLLLPAVLAQQGPNARWLEPNGTNPDFSQTYSDLDTVTFSWLALNNSVSDLWLTSYDASTDTYAKILDTEINLAQAGNFQFTFNLKASVINADDRFCLRFVPSGDTYTQPDSAQDASPGFRITRKLSDATGASATQTVIGTTTAPSVTAATASAQTSPSNESSSRTSTAVSGAGRTAQATATSSSTSVPAQSAHQSELGTGAIAGIVIGAAVAVGVLIALGWVMGGARRHKRALELPSVKETSPAATEWSSLEEGPDRPNSDSHPPLEFKGDTKHPIEMNVRNSRQHWAELE